MLIACAFNYDAHTTEFESLGRVPVPKARRNADPRMAGELRNTSNANLFVIFGEPDVILASGRWLAASGGRMVANYNIVKELSGLGSLEEIKGAGRDGLSLLRAVPAGRKIRNNRTGGAVGGVGSGEHSGGSGAPRLEGVFELSGVSSGSLAETETFLLLAQRLRMAPEEQDSPRLAQASEVGRMPNGLKRSLRSRT